MTIETFRQIFLSAILALALSPFAIRLAPKLKLIDIPGSLPHKQHERAVPVIGGWVLAAAVLAVGLPGLIAAHSEILPVIALSGLIFVFGVIDDRFGLSAPMKLLPQFAAAAGVVLSGVQVLLFPPPWGWLNVLITVIWLVGVTNAFNFVDSMDGLAVGLAGTAAAFFLLVTQEAGQADLSVFCAALLGGCIGVYFLNSMPARMFLGDAGSQWLGFVLAGIAIAYTPQGFERSQSWFIPILLMGVPIFDASLILISRLRRKRPWYRGNLDHTYHRLVKFGVPGTRAVLAMHTVELLLCCLAFIQTSLQPLWANLVFAGCLLAGAGLFLWMDDRKRWP